MLTKPIKVYIITRDVENNTTEITTEVYVDKITLAKSGEDYRLMAGVLEITIPKQLWEQLTTQQSLG
jgi:hypothetical protein